jgi:putative nucleotidyltransferase with HDIG domain
MSVASASPDPINISFASLSGSAQAFIVAVVGAGLYAICHSVYTLYSSPVTSQWFLLAALTLLSGSITVKLPSIPATLSVSETFVFTSVLLFGTAAGTITVTLDGLIISLWLTRTKLELHKLLFNTTAPALSIWIAAQLFFGMTGAAPLNNSATSVAPLLPGMLIFALVYFLLNSWLMATAVSFEQSATPVQVWRQNFLWLSLTFFSGASVAILLVSISRDVNLSALAVIVPLLVISYLTYHTSLGRIEDANQHVRSLNRLYLSTIETLAMAIDAKDQVTHGHIRRVQEHSVSLARYLGVNDASLIKAIEAASLLHDMGKLAIPEHILNKPGKLTEAEFSVMKTHASVGADILGAIEFPYPVLPIVRHHHENWDGSGYPDGLSGTDIPIGARILAVVDCFDALTSDRPYRRRLSNAEAVEILICRRATMYDPLVVDAFIQLLSSKAVAVGSSVPANSEDAMTTVYSGRSVASACDGEPTIPLSMLAFPYRIEVLAEHLTHQNGAMMVLFVPGLSGRNLSAMRIWGNCVPNLERMNIPLGKGVSGWVAIRREPLFDCDAALDFVNCTAAHPSELKCCDAVPVAVGSNVFGVLTIYRNSTLYSADRAKESLILMCEEVSAYLAYRLVLSSNDELLSSYAEAPQT